MSKYFYVMDASLEEFFGPVGAKSFLGNRKEAIMKFWSATLCVALTLGLTACDSGQKQNAQPVYQPPVQQAPVVLAYSGPVLRMDGTCEGDAPVTTSTIDVGISECELVRLKGKLPTDVLIGESGRGGRETQVLYAEPEGRELYFFINNKLDRTVKPGA